MTKLMVKILVVLSILTGIVSAEPVHNLDTGNNFATIQAAIDDTSTVDGQTIAIDQGTYNENVNVNKQLNIRPTSGNSFDTIVDGSGSGDVFYITAKSKAQTTSIVNIISNGWYHKMQVNKEKIQVNKDEIYD